MNDYKEIHPYELELPACRAIGKDWMLICARSGSTVNAMTASWGFLGEIWSVPAAVCFIRPPRYTFGLVDGSEYFSLCFFGGERKRELSYFGSHSGRDGDKAAACGMSYGSVEVGNTEVPYVTGAQKILVCRKLYFDDIKPEGFTDPDMVEKNYPGRDFHRMFIGGIEKCFELIQK
ncbi:MAG: flavin reductase family protein [Clostridiales bacterium]|nr:flavin reductase family protein [Clostridiales bacterium]